MRRHERQANRGGPPTTTQTALCGFPSSKLGPDLYFRRKRLSQNRVKIQALPLVWRVGRVGKIECHNAAAVRPYPRDGAGAEVDGPLKVAEAFMHPVDQFLCIIRRLKRDLKFSFGHCG